MKIKLATYAHEANGIGISLVPESDIEEDLLRTLWDFGKMEVVHGPEFMVRAFKEKRGTE